MKVPKNLVSILKILILFIPLLVAIILPKKIDPQNPQVAACIANFNFIPTAYAVEAGYCENGYTFNGGDAGDDSAWEYTGCGEDEPREDEDQSGDDEEEDSCEEERLDNECRDDGRVYEIYRDCNGDYRREKTDERCGEDNSDEGSDDSSGGEDELSCSDVKQFYWDPNAGDNGACIKKTYGERDGECVEIFDETDDSKCDDRPEEDEEEQQNNNNDVEAGYCENGWTFNGGDAGDASAWEYTGCGLGGSNDNDNSSGGVEEGYCENGWTFLGGDAGDDNSWKWTGCGLDNPPNEEDEVKPGYCENGWTFNGGDAGDASAWKYTGCGVEDSNNDRSVEPGYCENGWEFLGGDAGDDNSWKWTGCGLGGSNDNDNSSGGVEAGYCENGWTFLGGDAGDNNSWEWTNCGNQGGSNNDSSGGVEAGYCENGWTFLGGDAGDDNSWRWTGCGLNQGNPEEVACYWAAGEGDCRGVEWCQRVDYEVCGEVPNGNSSYISCGVVDGKCGYDANIGQLGGVNACDNGQDNGGCPGGTVCETRESGRNPRAWCSVLWGTAGFGVDEGYWANEQPRSEDSGSPDCNNPANYQTDECRPLIEYNDWKYCWDCAAGGGFCEEGRPLGAQECKGFQQENVDCNNPQNYNTDQCRPLIESNDRIFCEQDCGGQDRCEGELGAKRCINDSSQEDPQSSVSTQTSSSIQSSDEVGARCVYTENSCPGGETKTCRGLVVQRGQDKVCEYDGNAASCTSCREGDGDYDPNNDRSSCQSGKCINGPGLVCVTDGDCQSKTDQQCSYEQGLAKPKYYCDGETCIAQTAGWDGSACQAIYKWASPNNCPNQCKGNTDVSGNPVVKAPDPNQGKRCAENVACESGQNKVCTGITQEDGRCDVSGGSCSACSDAKVDVNNDRSECTADGRCINGPGKVCVDDAQCKAKNDAQCKVENSLEVSATYCDGEACIAKTSGWDGSACVDIFKRVPEGACNGGKGCAGNTAASGEKVEALNSGQMCFFNESCGDGSFKNCRSVYSREGVCKYIEGVSKCTSCGKTEYDPSKDKASCDGAGRCQNGPGAACVDDNDCGKPYVAASEEVGARCVYNEQCPDGYFKSCVGKIEKDDSGFSSCKYDQSGGGCSQCQAKQADIRANSSQNKCSDDGRCLNGPGFVCTGDGDCAKQQAARAEQMKQYAGARCPKSRESSPGKMQLCFGVVSQEGVCELNEESECSVEVDRDKFNPEGAQAYCEAGKCQNGPGKACQVDSHCYFTSNFEAGATCKQIEANEDGSQERVCKGVGDGKICDLSQGGGSCSQWQDKGTIKLGKQAYCQSGVCIGAPAIEGCASSDECPKPLPIVVNRAVARGVGAGQFTSNGRIVEAVQKCDEKRRRVNEYLTERYYNSPDAHDSNIAKAEENYIDCWTEYVDRGAATVIVQETVEIDYAASSVRQAQLELVSAMAQDASFDPDYQMVYREEVIQLDAAQAWLQQRVANSQLNTLPPEVTQVVQPMVDRQLEYAQQVDLVALADEQRQVNVLTNELNAHLAETAAAREQYNQIINSSNGESDADILANQRFEEARNRAQETITRIAEVRGESGTGLSSAYQENLDAMPSRLDEQFKTQQFVTKHTQLANAVRDTQSPEVIEAANTAIKANVQGYQDYKGVNLIDSEGRGRNTDAESMLKDAAAATAQTYVGIYQTQLKDNSAEEFTPVIAQATAGFIKAKSELEGLGASNEAQQMQKYFDNAPKVAQVLRATEDLQNAYRGSANPALETSGEAEQKRQTAQAALSELEASGDERASQLRAQFEVAPLLGRAERLISERQRIAATGVFVSEKNDEQLAEWNTVQAGLSQVQGLNPKLVDNLNGKFNTSAEIGFAQYDYSQAVGYYLKDPESNYKEINEYKESMQRRIDSLPPDDPARAQLQGQLNNFSQTVTKLAEQQAIANSYKTAKALAFSAYLRDENGIEVGDGNKEALQRIIDSLPADHPLVAQAQKDLQDLDVSRQIAEARVVARQAYEAVPAEVKNDGENPYLQYQSNQQDRKDKLAAASAAHDQMSALATQLSPELMKIALVDVYKQKNDLESTYGDAIGLRAEEMKATRESSESRGFLGSVGEIFSGLGQAKDALGDGISRSVQSASISLKSSFGQSLSDTDQQFIDKLNQEAFARQAEEQKLAIFRESPDAYEALRRAGISSTSDSDFDSRVKRAAENSGVDVGDVSNWSEGDRQRFVEMFALLDPNPLKWVGDNIAGLPITEVQKRQVLEKVCYDQYGAICGVEANNERSLLSPVIGGQSVQFTEADAAKANSLLSQHFSSFQPVSSTDVAAYSKAVQSCLVDKRSVGCREHAATQLGVSVADLAAYEQTVDAYGLVAEKLKTDSIEGQLISKTKLEESTAVNQFGFNAVLTVVTAGTARGAILGATGLDILTDGAQIAGKVGKGLNAGVAAVTGVDVVKGGANLVATAGKALGFAQDGNKVFSVGDLAADYGQKAIQQSSTVIAAQRELDLLQPSFDTARVELLRVDERLQQAFPDAAKNELLVQRAQLQSKVIDYEVRAQAVEIARQGAIDELLVPLVARHDEVRLAQSVVDEARVVGDPVIVRQAEDALSQTEASVRKQLLVTENDGVVAARDTLEQAQQAYKVARDDISSAPESQILQRAVELGQKRVDTASENLQRAQKAAADQSYDLGVKLAYQPLIEIEQRMAPAKRNLEVADQILTQARKKVDEAVTAGKSSNEVEQLSAQVTAAAQNRLAAYNAFKPYVDELESINKPPPKLVAAETSARQAVEAAKTQLKAAQEEVSNLRLRNAPTEMLEDAAKRQELAQGAWEQANGRLALAQARLTYTPTQLEGVVGLLDSVRKAPDAPPLTEALSQLRLRNIQKATVDAELASIQGVVTGLEDNVAALADRLAKSTADAEKRLYQERLNAAKRQLKAQQENLEVVAAKAGQAEVLVKATGDELSLISDLQTGKDFSKRDLVTNYAKVQSRAEEAQVEVVTAQKAVQQAAQQLAVAQKAAPHNPITRIWDLLSGGPKIDVVEKAKAAKAAVDAELAHVQANLTFQQRILDNLGNRLAQVDPGFRARVANAAQRPAQPVQAPVQPINPPAAPRQAARPPVQNVPPVANPAQNIGMGQRLAVVAQGVGDGLQLAGEKAIQLGVAAVDGVKAGAVKVASSLRRQPEDLASINFRKGNYADNARTATSQIPGAQNAVNQAADELAKAQGKFVTADQVYRAKNNRSWLGGMGDRLRGGNDGRIIAAAKIEREAALGERNLARTKLVEARAKLSALEKDKEQFTIMAKRAAVDAAKRERSQVQKEVAKLRALAEGADAKLKVKTVVQIQGKTKKLKLADEVQQTFPQYLKAITDIERRGGDLGKFDVVAQRAWLKAFDEGKGLDELKVAGQTISEQQKVALAAFLNANKKLDDAEEAARVAKANLDLGNAKLAAIKQLTKDAEQVRPQILAENRRFIKGLEFQASKLGDDAFVDGRVEIHFGLDADGKFLTVGVPGVDTSAVAVLSRGRNGVVRLESFVTEAANLTSDTLARQALEGVAPRRLGVLGRRVEPVGARIFNQRAVNAIPAEKVGNSLALQETINNINVGGRFLGVRLRPVNNLTDARIKELLEANGFKGSATQLSQAIERVKRAVDNRVLAQAPVAPAMRPAPLFRVPKLPRIPNPLARVPGRPNVLPNPFRFQPLNPPARPAAAAVRGRPARAVPAAAAGPAMPAPRAVLAGDNSALAQKYRGLLQGIRLSDGTVDPSKLAELERLWRQMVKNYDGKMCQRLPGLCQTNYALVGGRIVNQSNIPVGNVAALNFLQKSLLLRQEFASGMSGGRHLQTARAFQQWLSELHMVGNYGKSKNPGVIRRAGMMSPGGHSPIIETDVAAIERQLVGSRGNLNQFLRGSRNGSSYVDDGFNTNLENYIGGDPSRAYLRRMPRTEVDLPDIPKEHLPLIIRNTAVNGQIWHLYPNPGAIKKYYMPAMQKRLQAIDSVPAGSHRAKVLQYIAEFYQIGINARMYDNVNQTMIMNMTNVLLEKHGFAQIRDGIPDFLAHNLDSRTFQKWMAGEVGQSALVDQMGITLKANIGGTRVDVKVPQNVKVITVNRDGSSTGRDIMERAYRRLLAQGYSQNDAKDKALQEYLSKLFGGQAKGVGAFKVSVSNTQGDEVIALYKPGVSDAREMQFNINQVNFYLQNQDRLQGVAKIQGLVRDEQGNLIGVIQKNAGMNLHEFAQRYGPGAIEDYAIDELVKKHQLNIRNVGVAHGDAAWGHPDARYNGVGGYRVVLNEGNIVVRTVLRNGQQRQELQFIDYNGIGNNSNFFRGSGWVKKGSSQYNWVRDREADMLAQGLLNYKRGVRN